MTDTHPHASHRKIISRLKRAEGHLASVISMMEDERPCLVLAQQLQAVESAIRNAKQSLIHEHIDHCLDADAPHDKDEIRAISRYL